VFKILFFVAAINSPAIAPDLDIDLNQSDKEIFRELVEYIKHKEELRNAPVCPIEPGTVWNLECA